MTSFVILSKTASQSRVSSRQLFQAIQSRQVSSSPYGRTHVWKKRARTLPPPFVPTFPQLVVRADGSTFTHYTTSPKSVFRLTRDTTNNPLWNTKALLGETDEEDAVTGRLGRFNRRFEGVGGYGGEVEWMSGVEQSQTDPDKLKAMAWQGVEKKVKDKKRK